MATALALGSRRHAVRTDMTALLAIVVIGAGGSGCALQLDALVPPRLQLEGTWTGTYQCPLGVQQLETIHVALRGRTLIATKLTGDACVPAGFVTWEAALPSSVIHARDLPLSVGVAITEGASGRMGSILGRLTIFSSERMIIDGAGGIDLTRNGVPGQPPPSGAPPQGQAPPATAQWVPPVAPAPSPPGPSSTPAFAPTPTGPPPAAGMPASAVAPQGTTRSTPPGRPRCEAPSNTGVTAEETALAKRLSNFDQPDVAKADLNGDGRPDFFVADHDCGNMRVCGTTVYLSQGATYVAAFGTEDGEFDQVDEIAVGSGAANGACDLLTGGMRYSWNGKAYKKSGKAPVVKATMPPSPAAKRGPPLSFIAKMSKEEFTLPLYDDPDVKKRFRAVLGKDFQFFLERLNGVGGVETRDGYVVGWACMRHECTVEDVAFVINIATEEIHCAIRSASFKNTFRIYGRDKNHPPAALTRIMKERAAP